MTFDLLEILTLRENLDVDADLGLLRVSIVPTTNSRRRQASG